MSLHDWYDIFRWPIYDPRPDPLPAPTVSVGDGPKRVLCVNEEWAGHIIGLLSRLLRSDAWSGDFDHAHAQIENIIAQLATPWEGDCPQQSDENGNENGNGNDDENGNRSGQGGIVLEGNEDMGQVVTDVFIDEETGELVVQFGPCCEHRYPMADPTGEDIPDDFNPGEDPDDPDQEFSACGKAYTFVHALADMVQAGLDNYTSPFAFPKAVRDAVSWAKLGTQDLYLFLFDIASVRKVIAEADIINEDLIAEMVCRAYVGLADTADVSNEEYEFVLNSVKSAIFDSSLEWSGCQLVWTIWEQAYQTLGYQDGLMAMKLGANDLTQSCLCPGEYVPYEGEVKFSGAVTAATNLSWVRNVATLNNGKILEFDWAAPSGDYKEDATLAFGIIMPTPLTSLDIRLTPRTGTEVPTKDWQNSGCGTLSPSLWAYTDFGSTWTETAVNVVTGAEPSVDWHCVADTPPATKTSFEFNPRKCPDNPGGAAKTYYLRLEIVKVNGVEV